MATLEEIRARLQANENNSNNVSDAIFPFWNQPDGTTSVVRFLPDKNESNPFFWVERNVIKLPFNGIKGDPTSKKVEVHVPCMELWNEECPVLKEIRPWFNDPSLEKMARAYWKKRSYIFNGLVVSTELLEENPPESPVRRFIIGPQIFNIIKSALMDSDIEVIPTDYDRGLDFRMTKTSKGGFNDYSTSNWARKERALSDDELNSVNTHGLFDLQQFLPKKPTSDEVEIIKEMFEKSVDGEAYDSSLWGRYYKPFGVNIAVDNNGVNAEVIVNESDVEKAEEDLKAEDKTNADESSNKAKSAEDILATIRQRQQTQ